MMIELWPDLAGRQCLVTPVQYLRLKVRCTVKSHLDARLRFSGFIKNSGQLPKKEKRELRELREGARCITPKNLISRASGKQGEDILMFPLKRFILKKKKKKVRISVP